ncbi:hypothetical protein GA0074692_0060 [Micromonospora pallida]|uniref:Uncharacterized protein n=1 Tax=Micromonospora pallida TaxID=145854 RepID=A0A1C6RIH8_9ACTN|nr:hypothetical protein GA0074692_0060 [Micromonospora pallida]
MASSAARSFAFSASSSTRDRSFSCRVGGFGIRAAAATRTLPSVAFIFRSVLRLFPRPSVWVRAVVPKAAARASTTGTARSASDST